MATYYVGDFPQPYSTLARARKEAISMAEKSCKFKSFANISIDIKSSNGLSIRKTTVGKLTYAKYVEEPRYFSYVPVKDGKMQKATSPIYVNKKGMPVAKSKVRF